MGICYLYGAGSYYTDGMAAPSDDDYIIAVDGGYNFLNDRHIFPHLIVGDFDSIDKKNTGILSGTHIPIISFPPEKDYTDMYLASAEGIKCGYTDFIIYGGCGGRIDHTLSNISLLAHLAAAGCHAYLVANGYVITAVKDSSLAVTEDGNIITAGAASIKKAPSMSLPFDAMPSKALPFRALPFKAKNNGYISVLSHSDISRGVTISGLKYEADDITITNTMVLGTSNEFCGRNALVSVESGTLIILIQI